MAKPSPGVREFFEDQNVLVTGATGFLGKVIVEKLLRSCPGVKSIYLLIRPTVKCSDVRARLAHLLGSPLFDTLKESDSKLLEKVHAISGDIGLPSVGLSEEDKDLLTSTISVVIHSAATVKFDDPLSQSLTLNVKGLQRIIAVCKEMKDLKALVHISTGYANCDREVIEEKVYPPPDGTDQILKSLLAIDDDIAVDDNMMKIVRKCRPNTYAYTKAIAEHVLTLEAADLPVCIVRPTIVTGSIKDPIPGWIDSRSGATGLICGIGLGALRLLRLNGSKALNLIPVDIVVNLILCAAWETCLRKEGLNPRISNPGPVTVYNCGVSKSNPMKLGKLVAMLEENLRNKCPFSRAALYPAVTTTTSGIFYALCNIFLQFIPAHLLNCINKKTRALKIYEILSSSSKGFEHFTLNEWDFQTDNMKTLHKGLSEEERECFHMNADDVDWKSYIELYCRGIRKHVMRDEDATLERAQQHMTWLCRGRVIIILIIVLVVAVITALIVLLSCNIL